MEFIPLSLPYLAGNEWKYVKDCLDTGWISSAGAYVTQFEQMVADYAGAKYGIACMNGTAGLHLCMEMHGIGAGDYIITPNITFIATLNSIKYTGADPILIDVDPQSWQMDLDLLESFLTENVEVRGDASHLKSDGKRIAGIMPVHVLGNMGDMDRLVAIAKKFNLLIIEDSTEALGSTYNGKHAGTFGKMGVFSFNGNKIISTGGGGVVVTDDETLAKRAKHLTTQAKAKPDEYFHDAIGYNYRLVNILAAVGVAQLEQFPDFLKRKKRMDNFYRTELSNTGDIRFQKVPEGTDPNCWLSTFSSGRKKELIEYLNANGVMCRPFWVPMNQLPMFQKELYVTENDNAGKVYDTCLSIPSSTGLTDAQLERVVKVVQESFATSEV